MTQPQQASHGARLVGCAGWTIPKVSAAAFPEAGSHLQRFASVFSAVEVNSSFYRPHRQQTWARWAASVPDGFRFSVKLPKAITHEARLRGADALLEKFALEAGALGDKLGCVLVQLPPKLAFEADAAHEVFERLVALFDCTIACEARNPSWFADDATALLRERGVTRVIADPAAGQPGPHVPTGPAMYVRLHGSPRVYYSPYSTEYLSGLALQLAAHTAAGHDAWCIFDNTMSPTFVDQALFLRAEIERNLVAGTPGA
jgi:uncharacterized protein YecE (DUF72 family)